MKFSFWALSLLAVLAGCAVNPVSGSRELSLVSAVQEIEIGREQHPRIIEQYGLYQAPDLQEYVQRVGEALAEKSHRSDLAYRFTVLDSPEVNAFALPGGYIYITRGLLAYLNSEDELAAVLGHEIGHVTARHSARQISAATASDLGYTIGALFVPELRTHGAQDLFNVLGTAWLRGYGREHELEADRLGAEYLAADGRNPGAMLDVIGVLKNQEWLELERAKAEGREPRVYHGLFSTHPDNDARLQAVVKAAERLAGTDRAETPREPFLHRLEGLPFGESGRQGVLHGSAFYHRALGFGLDLPAGWRVENLPDRLIALAPDRQAGMQLSVEPVPRDVSPEQYLREQVGRVDLKRGEALGLGGEVKGFTALAPISLATGRRTGRVAVLFHGDHAFQFVGTVEERDGLEAYDDAFLASLRSFHALTPEEARLAEPPRLTVVEAKGGDTFAALARRTPLERHAETQLRLLNDRYPDGEPVAGEFLKTLKLQH